MTEAVRDELATLQQQGRLCLLPSIFMETISKQCGKSKYYNSKDKDSLQQRIVLLPRQRVLAQSIT